MLSWASYVYCNGKTQLDGTTDDGNFQWQRDISTSLREQDVAKYQLRFVIP